MPKKVQEQVRHWEGDLEDVIERLVVATVPEDKRDRFFTYADPSADDDEEFVTVAAAEEWAKDADDEGDIRQAIAVEEDRTPTRKGVVNALRARLSELEEEE